MWPIPAAWWLGRGGLRVRIAVSTMRDRGPDMNPASIPASQPKPSQWVTGRVAGQIAGCSLTALYRAALMGEIRTERAPDCPPRYRREDVERFAASRRAPSERKGA